VKTNLNRNTVFGVLIVIAFTFCLGFLAIRSTKADKPAGAPLEISPTVEQQKPIQDLLTEKKACVDRKEGEISGAIKMLMRLTADPTTGKVGLDPEKWSAVGDGKDGFKFVQVAPPSPASTQSKP